MAGKLSFNRHALRPNKMNRIFVEKLTKPRYRRLNASLADFSKTPIRLWFVTSKSLRYLWWLYLIDVAIMFISKLYDSLFEKKKTFSEKQTQISIPHICDSHYTLATLESAHTPVAGPCHPPPLSENVGVFRRGVGSSRHCTGRGRRRDRKTESEKEVSVGWSDPGRHVEWREFHSLFPRLADLESRIHEYFRMRIGIFENTLLKMEDDCSLILL